MNAVGALPAGRLRLFVEGLEIAARIGVHHHERAAMQPLIIDVEMEIAASPHDRIGDTVDYNMVVAAATTLAEGAHIDLVEHFARALAALLHADTRVRGVSVRVAKPTALAGARAAGACWQTGCFAG